MALWRVGVVLLSCAVLAMRYDRMSVCLGPVLVFLFGALYRLSRFACFALRLIAGFVRAACIWRCLCVCLS